MKSIFLFVAFTFLSISSLNAQVSYGCVSNDTGLIYPDLAYGTTYDISNPEQPNQGDFCNPKAAGSCRMRVSFNCRECTGPDKNGWYYQAGKQFSYIACPIDDYTPFVILAVGGAGFLFIRKRALQLPL